MKKMIFIFSRLRLTKRYIFRILGCIMFSGMVKCGNLGVIKQLGTVKGEKNNSGVPEDLVSVECAL